MNLNFIYWCYFIFFDKGKTERSRTGATEKLVGCMKFCWAMLSLNVYISRLKKNYFMPGFLNIFVQGPPEVNLKIFFF